MVVAGRIEKKYNTRRLSVHLFPFRSDWKRVEILFIIFIK